MHPFIASIVLSSADPSLGKIDKSALSHQTLMELLIDKTENTDDIRDSDHQLLTISQWEYSDSEGMQLNLVALNGHNEVTNIDFRGYGLHGSVQLEWLPLTTLRCDFSFNNLAGTIDLEHLPDALTRLFLYQNALSGSVCLTQLPRQMKWLNLAENKFSGSLDLRSLPESLEWLQLFGNGFSGWTDFSQLPQSLSTLDLTNTRLEGTLVVADWQIFETENSNVKMVQEDEKE